MIVILSISLYSCKSSTTNYNNQIRLVNSIDTRITTLSTSLDSLKDIYPTTDFKKLRYSLIDAKKEYKNAYSKLGILAEDVVLTNINK